MNNKNHTETIDEKENNNEKENNKKEIYELDEELLKEAAELGAKFKVNENDNNNEMNHSKDRDQLLRLAADFENFKRRSAKDIEDARNYAITNFVESLLTIKDNFERSIEALKQEDQDNPRVKAIIDGIIVIQKELQNSFSRQNINPITPVKGDDFDHNLHQAITQIPTNEVEEGKICNLMQVGYLMKDRLLRPALVGIAVRSDS